mmetsp:Transcript_8612/g.23153  ORF Transcript_8612/g.23153 Transcript_8612/m.23153 type:complete len:127 (+) Transcript_8612:141-521(+)
MSQGVQQQGGKPGSEDLVKDVQVNVESKHLAALNEQKAELLSKVHTLKKELGDWRSKLDVQVKTYRNEITDLRQTLNGEVEALRADFMDLRTSLKQQLELTSSLAASEVVEAERKMASTSNDQAQS